MTVLRVQEPAGDVILRLPGDAEVNHVPAVVVRSGGGFFVGMTRFARDGAGSSSLSRPLPGLVLRVR